MNDDSQLKTSYPNLTYSLKIKRPREPNALYLIEIEDNNIMSAFEFKWQKNKAKTPKNFKDNYKIETKVINNENYLDFIL